MALVLSAVAAPAAASTLTQNMSWTIDRPDTDTNYLILAYGDSIYAGYNGSLFNVARYAGPTVAAEYLSALWNADIQSLRLAKSGAVASDIYRNKIVSGRSFMQSSRTRAVTFEMCGNDGLQARTALKAQTGTCNYAGLNQAVSNCKTYVAAAMDFINANAYPGVKLKVIANLHYPGYDADNTQSRCRDPNTRATINLQDKFLPELARMNYWMCEYARQKGFQCSDTFADFMGSDYDRNGDGVVDSEALRFMPGESESNYVTRITSTLRSTIRDSKMHLVSASSSFDYIQSDDTHPSYTGPTVGSGLLGGSTGTGAARYSSSIVGGKNPIWNRYGHERMGWRLSTYSPPAP